MSRNLEQLGHSLKQRIDETYPERDERYKSFPLDPNSLERQPHESERSFEQRVREMYVEAVVAPYIGLGVLPQGFLKDLGMVSTRIGRFAMVKPYIPNLTLRACSVLIGNDMVTRMRPEDTASPTEYEYARKHGVVEETIRRRHGWLEERMFPFEEEV